MKVSFNKKTPEAYSSNGVVESCLFRYTADIGPNWYIGGIDAHGIQHWRIENNVFENIASPSKHIAEHAIHLWNATKFNKVQGNLIIDSDRGVGFGMRNSKVNKFPYSNLGGVIRDNVFIHSDNSHPYADVPIIVEDSPDTLIKGNIALSLHSYSNAVEVRFAKSSNVKVIGNVSNAKFKSRDGGEAMFLGNHRLSEREVSKLIKQKLDLVD